MPFSHIALDHVGHLPLRISRRDDGTVQLDISLIHVTRLPLIMHLIGALRATCDEGGASSTNGAPHPHNVSTSFTQPAATLHASLPAHHHGSITLHERTLLSWHWQDDARATPTITSHTRLRLTVMELRMLGQYPHQSVPYPRNHANQRPPEHRITTDLHTHLSSQISAQGLLDVASATGATYPVELLDLHDIDYSHCELHRMPSTPFAPAQSEGLVCEQAGQTVDAVAIADLITNPASAAILRDAMHIAADEVVTFDQLERRIYRLRNPLTKDPATIAATIHQVAREYADMGVTYAELAVTAALNTDWMAHALPALEQAERDTGVALRLLAAVPRAMPPMKLLRQLELLKFVAQHPMVVGADFLGYEANKTRNFRWALSNIARWASLQARGITHSPHGWQFNDDFIIRVHAGENGKNPDNVIEVLDIARAHNVRVRVGHATYSDMTGCMDSARALGKDGKLIVEFNPDSNMAMNNIDHAKQLPIARWADEGVPFVISSDGAGICQTDSTQLLAASMFAGLTSEHIAQLMRTQTTHIDHQRALFTAKHAAFTAHHGTNDAFITRMRRLSDTLQSPAKLPHLRGKIPILIAGASGSSWTRITPNDQDIIARGITKLVNTLDPQRVYFALGRVKHEGIGRLLDNALTERLDNAPASTSFDVVGMLSGHQNMPTLADHINHIIPLHGELMSIPTQMTQHLKRQGGCALYIGGSAFTRDFIMCSDQLGIPFGVMADIAGASGEKAHVLPKRYSFSGVDGMLHHITTLLGAEVLLSSR